MRLCNLQLRCDLNDVHGIVRSKQGTYSYEIRIGRKSVLAKLANLDFVGHIPLVFDLDRLSPELMKDVYKIRTRSRQ